MELITKLYVADDEGVKYMGIGVLWLMERIRDTGSLRQAAISMGLSYSKAYGMISNLEKNLGRTVIERKKGGSSNEGASLTPFALEYMKLYNEFQEEAKQAASGIFDIFRKKAEALMEEKDDSESAV